MDKLIDPKFTAGKSWFEKCVSLSLLPRPSSQVSLSLADARPHPQGPLHERRRLHRAHKVLLRMVHRVCPLLALLSCYTAR